MKGLEGNKEAKKKHDMKKLRNKNVCCWIERVTE